MIYLTHWVSFLSFILGRLIYWVCKLNLWICFLIH